MLPGPPDSQPSAQEGPSVTPEKPAKPRTINTRTAAGRRRASVSGGPEWEPRPNTAEEQRAIQALERLAKRWPRSLTLFNASGTLCVLHTDEHSESHPFGDAIVTTIWGIPNEGGDPDLW
jgi:hypothetical protein